MVIKMVYTLKKNSTDRKKYVKNGNVLFSIMNFKLPKIQKNHLNLDVFVVSITIFTFKK
jgi:hypothetical protein